MVLHLAAFFLLLCVFPDVQFNAQAVQIIGQGDGPPPTSTPAADTGIPVNLDPSVGINGQNSQQQSVIARNRALDDLIQNGVPPDMWIVLVCAGLHDIVPRCSTVPRLNVYLSGLPNQRVRRKRSWFGTPQTSWNAGSWNEGGWNINTNPVDPWPNTLNDPWRNTWNSDPWPNTANRDPWPNTANPDPWPNTVNSDPWKNAVTPKPWAATGTNTASAIVCPSALDQSAVYSLSGNSNAYPAAEIGQEIQNVPAIRDCLLRELIIPGNPPTLVVEPFHVTANVTCLYMEMALWSYMSQATGMRCWILQNFQEVINFRNCTSKFCENCLSKPDPTLTQITKGVTGNKWATGSTWTTGTVNATRPTQKFCIPEYRTVSVWAYCPQLLQGTRIIRDRLIVPFACTCQTIECEASPNW